MMLQSHTNVPRSLLDRLVIPLGLGAWRIPLGLGVWRIPLAVAPMPRPGEGDAASVRAIKRALTKWLETARGRVSERDILDAIVAGNPAIIADKPVWGEAWKEIEAEWRDAALDALKKAGAKEVSRFGWGFRFDIDNPYAERWAAQHSAELVSAVSTETRKAISGLVHQGFVDGVPPLDTARALRPMLGLTERHAQAVRHQLSTLIADGTPFDKAMAASERYANRLLRHRAENIARTETVAAQNAGLDASWKTARDEGLVLPGAVRVWIAAPSARTCPICEALDGQEVPIDGEYQSADVGALPRPPAHPSCRCTQALVTR